MFPCGAVWHHQRRAFFGQFVKLFDIWGRFDPLKQPGSAEKAAIANDGDDVDRVIDVTERVAIDKYEVGERADRDSSYLQAQTQAGGGVNAGGAQYLFLIQACGCQRPEFCVQSDAWRQSVRFAAEQNGP
jgi:hypothetical protein